MVAKRIETIERDRKIALIERPECKRRWQSEPWEKKEREALTNWLLDRCEERSLWFGPDGNPRPMTVNRLADRLRENPDIVSVARLLSGPDADLADVLADITADEHVPYLAQLRYTGEGLLKRAIWEQTWERFISYPMASPDTDDALLLGWAGWDHREQAHALTTVIEERSATDGWDTDRLMPLLAGLSEVMPWVRQWHTEVDPRFGQTPADAYDAYLTIQRETHALTEESLRTWTPPQQPRARRRA